MNKPAETVLHEQRFEINNLLSDPKPKDLFWRSRVIVILIRITEALGLELAEKEVEEGRVN